MTFSTSPGPGIYDFVYVVLCCTNEGLVSTRTYFKFNVFCFAVISVSAKVVVATDEIFSVIVTDPDDTLIGFNATLEPQPAPFTLTTGISFSIKTYMLSKHM